MKTSQLKRAQELYTQGELLTKEITELCKHAESILHRDHKISIVIEDISPEGNKKKILDSDGSLIQEDGRDRMQAFYFSPWDHDSKPKKNPNEKKIELTCSEQVTLRVIQFLIEEKKCKRQQIINEIEQL